MYRCIVLSGLSGSGKSTLAQHFCSKFDWTFIEGDRFFLKNKPKVELSDGQSVSNWDTTEAIDWDSLNVEVTKQLKNNNVILATFLPRLDLFTFPVFRHIQLNTGTNPIEKCITARRVSKRLNTEAKQNRDELMVREYVYPEYIKTCSIQTDAVIQVYKDEERRNIGELTEELLLLLLI